MPLCQVSPAQQPLVARGTATSPLVAVATLSGALCEGHGDCSLLQMHFMSIISLTAQVLGSGTQTQRCINQRE